MLVMKFGGTSVGGAKCFARVAEIIQNAKIEHKELAVVVSAMSGVTDRLIDAARAAAEGEEEAYRQAKEALLSKHVGVCQAIIPDERERQDLFWLIEDRLHEFERFCRSFAVLGEVTVRGLDAVSSLGEKLSSAILAALLRARGLRAKAVDATGLIITDDNFGSASPFMEETKARVRQQLLPLLEQDIIPVVTGFIGATAGGVTTTLGRGGSDYSAAILGACLEADEVWIWTDVDGILTADPNIVPQAHTLAELSYAEAAELAYFGAEVLHPKTVRPLMERGIPLRIANTFNPSHPGTRIVKELSRREGSPRAIISTKGLSLIALAGDGEAWTPEMAARALSRLAATGVNVLMFSQSFSECSLSLLVRRGEEEHSLRALRREFEPELAQGVIPRLDVQSPVATISVVGRADSEGTGIVPQTFAALGKRQARVISIAQSLSEYNVSFVVPESEVNDTVQFLHHELRLGNGE